MSRRSAHVAKLVAGNLIVLFVLLCALNFVAALLYDGRHFLEEVFVPVTEKASRASLKDREKAKRIFTEFTRLKTKYVPFVEWSREPFRGETTTVNEQGDRVHATTTDAPIGRARFFGGSTMWGKGVDDEGTIPAKFNQLHPEFTVHNHGESGFVSRQELARLINLANQDEPIDLVVFYDGCNDFYTLCRSDTSLNGHSRENEMARRIRPPSMVADALTGALREVISWSWGRSQLTSGPSSRCTGDPEGAARVARTLLNNWRIARRVAAEAGAEFHAILQPVAVVGSPNIEHLDYIRDSPSRRVGDYEAVYPVARRLVRESGEPWIHDFSDAFDGDDQIYIDGCHVNEHGNEIIARRMDETFGGGWMVRAIRKRELQAEHP